VITTGDRAVRQHQCASIGYRDVSAEASTDLLVAPAPGCHQHRKRACILPAFAISYLRLVTVPNTVDYGIPRFSDEDGALILFVGAELEASSFLSQLLPLPCLLIWQKLLPDSVVGS
jgi:hypothetical protein